MVKIGYSTKDPALRATELDGTGVPYPFIVEYDVLVEDPRDVEQATHRLLFHVHENKEFFKTSIEIAVEMIRQSIVVQGKTPIVETHGMKLTALRIREEQLVLLRLQAERLESVRLKGERELVTVRLKFLQQEIVFSL